MSFKILSLNPNAGTIVVDWGSVVLNHYIPQQIIADSSLDVPSVLEIIERMRPAPPEPVVLPDALLQLVEVPAQQVSERLWRDVTMAPLLAQRDRHKDELDLGISTTLSAAQFDALLAYIQQLRDWPQSVAFPDSAQRPTAPPWIADQIQ